MGNISLTSSQEKVLDQIIANNSIHALIIGPCRSGKKFLANYIMDKYKLDGMDIKTSVDDIDIEGYDKYYLTSYNEYLIQK